MDLSSIRSHGLVALHVVVLVSAVWLFLQARYEDKLFEWFVGKTVSAESNDEERALALMHRTNQIVRPNAELFGDRPRKTVKGWALFSADQALLEGYGGCGSYSHVLARALLLAGIDARPVQMKVGDVWAGHIVVEAKLGGRWVVLDPLYDLPFRRPDGRLATFEDVSGNWAYYSKQAPADYNFAYRYEDRRYANWDKIPVIGRAARGALGAVLGEERVRTFAPRAYLLNAYRSYAVLILVAYVALLVVPSLIISWRRENGRRVARGVRAEARLGRS